MNIEQQRLAFEAKMGDMNITNFARDAEGWYTNTILEWHWRGWQAAHSDAVANLVLPPPDELLRIAAEQDYGDEDPKCLLRLAYAWLKAAGVPGTP